MTPVLSSELPRWGVSLLLGLSVCLAIGIACCEKRPADLLRTDTVHSTKNKKETSEARPNDPWRNFTKRYY